jgi:hypothetical protein
VSTSMIHFTYLAASAGLAIAAAPVAAGETTPVGWQQLPDPAVQEFEDPYRDVAPQQMTDLMSLVRLREELGRDDLATTERGQFEARSAELQAKPQESTSSGCCRNGGSSPIGAGRPPLPPTVHLTDSRWR